MTVSYNICPITGLSFSIKDDYKGQLFYNSVHPIVKDPHELFTLCEKKSNSIPKSFIIAGILLHLEREELIEHPEHEPKYLRGELNELLQSVSHYKLVELFWDTRNCMAHLSGEPLKINLSTTIKQGLTAIMDNIKAVAKQDVSAADMETYIETKSIKGRKRLKLRRQNMGLEACCTRSAKALPMLTEKLGQIYTDPPVTLESAKKAATYLAYCPRTGTPRFADAHPGIRTRLIEILDLTLTHAIDAMLLDRDSILAKSIKLVRKYVAGELRSIELDLEF